MKNIYLIIVSILILSTSCKTVQKSSTADYDYINITKRGILQRPLVTDLDVSTSKVTYQNIYENVSLSVAKENALGDFIKTNNCDIAIQPMFQTSTTVENEKSKTSVTVTAFTGKYINIKNYESKDSTILYHPLAGVTGEVPIYVPKVVAAEAAPLFKQTKTKTISSFGIDYSIPVGFYSDYSNGSMRFIYHQLYVNNAGGGFTSEVSYAKYSGKSLSFGYTFPDIQIVGLEYGYRFPFSNNFYFEPQLGVNYLFGGGGDNKVALALGLNAGYNISKAFSVNVKYDKSFTENNFNTLNFGLRLNW